MDLHTILLAHAKKYPRMEPTDAVKLLYQNEFGGGHLIRDEKACLDFLRQEYASVPQDSQSSLYEDIGNGMIRIHLAALDRHGLSLAALGSAFLRSAAIRTGSLDSFQEKLAVLTELTEAGSMPFSREMLAAYLADYRQAGFPMVSHSEAYRRAYHPAYRVVRADTLFENCKQMP
ncbi:MAG: hypothetical protein ACI3V0_01390 [Faecousia sp.]